MKKAIGLILLLGAVQAFAGVAGSAGRAGGVVSGGGGGSTITSGMTRTLGFTDSGLMYSSSGFVTTAANLLYQPASSTQTLKLGATAATTAVFDIVGSSTTGTVGVDIAGGNGGPVIDFWSEPTEVTLDGQLIGCNKGAINGTSCTNGDFVLIAGQVLSNQPNNIRFWGGNVDVMDISSGSVVMNKPLLVASTVGQTGPANTNDIFVATATMSTTATPFGEIRAVKIDATIVNPDTGTVSAALWTKMHCSDVSSTTGTFHCGGGFFEVFPSTASQEFSFGGEFHNVGGSTQPFAYTAGGVDHADWAGPSISSPTAPILATDNRAELTLPDRVTTRTDPVEVDIIGSRTEEFGPLQRHLYHLQGLNNWGHVAVLGDAFFISTFTQTLAAGATIIPACGGERDITAAAAVTTDPTNTFSAPSVSTAGFNTKGCISQIINGGAQPVVAKNNANFLTYGGVDQYVPSAAVMPIANNGSTWIQTGRVVYTNLNDIYQSSTTALANMATTGQFGNAGQIILSTGDWTVDADCHISTNTATVTAAAMAISTFTGNTTTDHVVGKNQVGIGIVPAMSTASGAIGKYRVAVAATTTLFVKTQATYASATPQSACTITAERR